ncbi:MAG: hypothetical protein HYZ09_04340 [Candidatus Kerfeldbacteria bacterium]|nr:hypothetical protein [Candidatus Kerfeldbacteria bacterium]
MCDEHGQARLRHVLSEVKVIDLPGNDEEAETAGKNLDPRAFNATFAVQAMGMFKAKLSAGDVYKRRLWYFLKGVHAANNGFPNVSETVLKSLNEIYSTLGREYEPSTVTA